ncbi:MAG: Collagen triple helix repeat (20 copies) [Firmicutes bacterium]|nr:Collagen triple helix repeat (20 copies) [Bacillota bacterium]
MDTIGLQIEKLSAGTVNTNSNVIFDHELSQFGVAISYNFATGEITVNQPGRYFINWWVATQSSLSSSGIAFSIVTSKGDEIKGQSPIKTGEVVGFALIQVDDVHVPMTLRLVNRTPRSHRRSRSNRSNRSNRSYWGNRRSRCHRSHR